MSKIEVRLTGSKEQKILQCLKAAGWYPDRRIDISPIEEYYHSQRIILPDGARAFLQEFYGIAECWEFAHGVWYDFALFPYRDAPQETPAEWMEDAPEEKNAAERHAGESLVMIGEIGYYYPARIWIGSGSTIYATYSYNENVKRYDNIAELIGYDFKEEWERVRMTK